MYTNVFTFETPGTTPQDQPKAVLEEDQKGFPGIALAVLIDEQRNNRPFLNRLPVDGGVYQHLKM